MIDVDDIVGSPYRFPPNPPHSYDCWTLLVEVRKRLGLHTPVHVNVEDYDLTTMDEAVHDELEAGVWQEAAIPRDGDAFLFYAGHIGVVLGKGVLHAHGPLGYMVFTRLDVLRRRWPRSKVYRA